MIKITVEPFLRYAAVAPVTIGTSTFSEYSVRNSETVHFFDVVKNTHKSFPKTCVSALLYISDEYS